jgi:uncharacterized protein (TIGR02453 family)
MSISRFLARRMDVMFSRSTLTFLEDLEKNNDRDWFAANKARYEECAREPMLAFIRAMAPRLKRISPHIAVSDRKAGGSMGRIHRDVRFSKDKSPYKTHAGLHFRHEAAADVHAPGFYLHLEPGQSFVGVGIWHPEPPTLKRLREAVARDAAGWRRATAAAGFKKRYRLSGDALKTPPRGFDPEHPLIEDIKRKDFIAVADLRDAQVLARDFPRRFAETCAAGAPFVGWLCKAVGVPF